MEKSLFAHVQSAFPPIKDRLCLSDGFTVDLAYELANDALLSLEECEIFSISEDVAMEVYSNDKFNDKKRSLSWKDTKMAPRAIESLLRTFGR